ncbi:MAG: hypothetical protein ACI3W5_13355 [Faecousia sp.]
MKKAIDIIYGIAIFMIFGGALCADSLGETTGGFLALFFIVGTAGAFILLGNRLEEIEYRQRRQRRGETTHYEQGFREDRY